MSRLIALGRFTCRIAKLFVFYVIFYGVLAALITVCILAFFRTLDPRFPKWQLNSSLIGTNPGLCLRPMPSGDQKIPEIWLRGTEWKDWVETLEEFLSVYKTPGLTQGRDQHLYDCDYDRRPGSGQVCDVNVKKWNPCIQENNYNFDKSAPCFFLKLNKIYGWEPEFYNNSQDLPEEMPQNLKKYITDLEKTDKKRLNTIWVSCEGEHSEDIKNIGTINYYPERGFQGYFYPYMNSEGYLSPLVAVHFQKPTTDVDISVVCIPWAKNIYPDKYNGKGRLEFILRVSTKH